jgi:UPF0755 protein
VNRKFNNKQVIAAILFLIALGTFAFFTIRAMLPGSREQVAAVIPDGSSVNDITRVLKEREIISNALVFKFYVFASGKTERLMPGRYVFKKNSPYRKVISDLVNGPKKVFYNLTIPDGFTLKQTGRRLSRIGGLSYKEFNVLVNDLKLYKYDFLKANTAGNLEGYLFPETYRLDAETQTAQVINMALGQFQKEYQAIKQRKMPLKLSLHQITTLASLVEREAKLKLEQPLVAAVIYNRLKKNMKLEIDATIQYALASRKKKLSLKDLELESPYNTYKYPGLPPSPIGSPGRSALKAALKPANVNYLYYVLVNEKIGKHFFTDNYKKFLEAKRKAN